MDTEQPSVVIPKPPSKQTLKKYGLTAELWLDMVKANGYVCPICGRSPPEISFAVDHEHCKGWKDRKLRKVLFKTPEQRRKKIRGIICLNCNLKFLPVGMTSEIAKKIVQYLETYKNRIKELDKEVISETI